MPPPRTSFDPKGLAGPIVVAIAGIVMLVWSWGKWPDPVIDFGRELYVPWRLAEGDVLYRDIVSYFNGPLTPYAHALGFKLFGPSLRVLIIFNLVLIAALVSMLYGLIAQAAGRLAATAAGVAFFVLFAFAQYLITSNYNYVTPYSYELPHGITLTAAALVCLARWVRTGRAAWLVACGVTVGLVLLTKAEIMLAAVAATGSGLVAHLFARRAEARTWARPLALFIGAAVVPPIIALILLSLAMSPVEAVRGMLGAWRWVGQRELTDLPYFRELAGTADIGASARRILTWTGYYLLLVTPALAFGALLRRTRRAAVGAVSVALLLATSSLAYAPVDWNRFIQPAPLVLLITAVALAVLLVRRRDATLVLPLSLTVWAGAMLAKMPLNAHIYHYGFALAMPATLMLIVILISWLPRAIEHFGGSGWPLRATLAGALGVVLWLHTGPLAMFYGIRTFPVGSGGDRFLADVRGVPVNALVHELSRVAEPGDTLLMLPEGLIVNYLARMVNPTGQLNFTPPAIIMYDEDEMLRAFEEGAPDWIGLTRIDTAEYGARFFGEDYAKKLGAWIEGNYERVNTFRMPGAPNQPFRIDLLRRRAALSPDTTAWGS